MRKRLLYQIQKLLMETLELCEDTLLSLTEKRREWLAARYISMTWDVGELLQRGEEIGKKIY